MSLFLDYLWIWIVLAFAMGVGGCALYFNDPRGRNLIIAILAPLLSLILGVTLYYGVDTDQKAITRTLNALFAAIEADNPDAVCQFISPKADELRQFVKTNMQAITISRAKYHKLEIAVNDATSPPTAHVRFATFFYWKTKSPIHGFSFDKPVPESMRFEIELVKTKDQSWLLTNKFQFFPSRNY
jgi:hypothetical protein